VSRILSQQEIDALLSSGPIGDEDAALDIIPSGGVVAYNFRRPDRVSKEHLRSLHFLHDRFALNVSTSLSAFLRAVTEVSIVSVEQFAYSEVLMSLPDPTAFYAVAMEPLDGLAAFELNPSVVFPMVDRLLGGTGLTPAPNRALTEIEQNVVDSVVKLLLENLTESWKPITEVQFRIHGRETRPQMLQVTGLNEGVILLVFDVRIADARGMLNLCIPASIVETIGERFAQGWHRQRREPSPQETAWLTANLGRVPLPVTALLQTELSARELLALRPGDVLALGRSASRPIDVHVSAVPRFQGRLTRAGGGVAIAVDHLIGEAGERVEEQAA
jgi:flagellar motor switch protein FliM